MAVGGRDEKGAMARLTTVKTLPRTVGVAGGETKKGELKENTGAKTRKPKSKPSRWLPSWRGGARQKAKTNTKWKGGTTHSPARGGSDYPKTNSREKTK